ncbi:GNAT family N-acetyltransferase [Candidatus Kapabacteria bacterium]|nr:GNAT family N-acetyltransferase [Candidatus Kapabacteria bacterium]
MATKESNRSLWTSKRQNKNFLIRKAELSDLTDIIKIAKLINEDLLSHGLDQWNHGYPNKETFTLDINESTQFILFQEDTLVGLVSINPLRNKNFFITDYEDKSDNFKIISRLGVHPDYQGKGLAGILMEFCENYCKSQEISSIRLGALKNYSKVVDFYLRREYKVRGEMFVERTNHTYYIMEKILRGNK